MEIRLIKLDEELTELTLSNEETYVAVSLTKNDLKELIDKLNECSAEDKPKAATYKFNRKSNRLERTE